MLEQNSKIKNSDKCENVTKTSVKNPKAQVTNAKNQTPPKEHDPVLYKKRMCNLTRKTLDELRGYNRKWLGEDLSPENMVRIKHAPRQLNNKHYLMFEIPIHTSNNHATGHNYELVDMHTSFIR